MRTMEIIFLIALIALAAYCVINIVKLKKLMVRNANVHDYRLSTLFRDDNAYNSLPSRQDMLYSDKPLEDKYWID